MYDISFILPVSSSIGRDTFRKEVNYSERIDFFKKYGIMNIKDKKVKIFLLVGNEEIKNIKEGWACDVEIIKCEFQDAARKIYKFYLDLRDITINESRWFMQIDDDSITNVNDMIDRLDSDYKIEDLINISNITPQKPARYLNSSMFKQFLTSVNKTSYKSILEKDVYSYVKHGWECNILSNGALKYFIKNLNNKKILEDILLFTGFISGDSFITICANLCGIKFYEVEYLTKNPLFNELMKKEVFHIHYIYYVKNYKQMSMFSKVLFEK